MYSIPLDTSSKSIIASFTPCHEINENLFVGSQLALDYDFLKLMNINVIISCRPLEYYQKKIITSLHIVHHDLKVKHSQFCKEYTTLQEKCNELFSFYLSQGKKVLIHCNSGFHRSVTLTAGYLMKINNWNYQTAFDFIKNIRPCVEMKYIVQENGTCITSVL